MSSKGSERIAVLAAVGPTSIDNTTISSNYASLALFNRAMAVVNISGALDVTAKVYLYKASDTSGTGSTTVATASIATASTTTRQRVLDFNCENTDTSLPYIGVVITGADTTNTVLGSAILLGLDPRYGPASDNDLSTVTIVT